MAAVLMVCLAVAGIAVAEVDDGVLALLKAAVKSSSVPEKQTDDDVLALLMKVATKSSSVPEKLEDDDVLALLKASSSVPEKQAYDDTAAVAFLRMAAEKSGDPEKFWGAVAKIALKALTAGAIAVGKTFLSQKIDG